MTMFFLAITISVHLSKKMQMKEHKLLEASGCWKRIRAWTGSANKCYSNKCYTEKCYTEKVLHPKKC